MSETSSNAYRQAAAEKRIQVAQIAAEANELDAKADELEGKTKPVEAVTTEVSDPDPEDKPKNKLFTK